MIAVQVKGDVLTLKDLKRSSVSWVSELSNALEIASSTNQRVYLTSSLIPLEGFANFTSELKSHPQMDNVRVLINLDKQTNFDLKQLYQKDLVLTVIKDGILNAYLPIPVEFKGDISVSHFSNSVDKNRRINYIGLNLRDETINPATEKVQELGKLCIKYD